MVQIGSYCQPMKPIKSFFAKIRYKLFVCFIEWEIYHKIFPHLLKRKMCEYPFSSDEELSRVNTQGLLNIERFSKIIGGRAEKMDKAYGEAFQYIMYRDLNKRMVMFERLIKQQTYPPL